MPDVGSAYYEGGLLATRIAPSGIISYYEAESQISANFVENTVVLNATNTRSLLTGDAHPDLNFFTTGGGDPNHATITGNAFSGGLIGFTDYGGGADVGDFAGAFYGPGATEVGGWFNAENGVLGRYFGSFGAKEQLP
jgi:hypothetical protein